MNKALATLALLCAIPLSTAAQPVPSPRMAPPAQPVVNGHGITVSGMSVARVAASSASVELQFSTVDNRPTLSEAQMEPVIDALVKAGVQRSAIHLPLALTGGPSNMTNLTAAIANPTVEQMRAGIASVGSVIAGMNNVRLINARVELTRATCTDALTKAREAAIAQARAQANATAAELHVRLGNVINVQVFDQGGADGSCTTQYFVGPLGPQFANGDSTDADYVNIPVFSRITVTYAIK